MHLMKWPPTVLREMAVGRPGASGSMGSSGAGGGAGLLIPLKTLIPVSLTLSFSPSRPALIPGLPPASHVPRSVAGVSSAAGPLTSRSPAAKCLRVLSSGGNKGLSFAFSKLLGTQFQ